MIVQNLSIFIFLLFSTKKDAAQFFAVSRSTIDRWIAKNNLPDAQYQKFLARAEGALMQFGEQWIGWKIKQDCIITPWGQSITQAQILNLIDKNSGLRAEKLKIAYLKKMRNRCAWYKQK